VTPVALTIAGSDPSGGAGIQADLKTFHQFGVYGEAAITLLTVQNTTGIARVECVPASLVAEQVRAAIEDIPPQAAKTGALGSLETVEALAELAAGFEFPLVVDPVMAGSQGGALASAEARQAIAALLLPLAFLVMPNLDEAAALTGIEVKSVSAMREAAARLCAMGARAALVKGGHLEDSATDVLYADGAWHEFTAPRIPSRHTHGTGCTYSAAVTAELARGSRLEEAVARAKAFVTGAIRGAPGLGRGCGPLNHHASRG
jgi:hydroxymethylpyrimidine/phosphomethylpyrimidine kinase